MMKAEHSFLQVLCIFQIYDIKTYILAIVPMFKLEVQFVKSVNCTFK